MNSAYSPALAAACSVRCYWDGLPLVTLKTTIIANESLRNALQMDSCQTLPSSAISTHSSVTGSPQAIREWLMSSRQDSPVSHLRQEGSIEENATSAICGLRPFVLYESSSRNGYTWKIAQGCLPGMENSLLTLEQLLETWPKAGMWDDGACYQQPLWDSLTGVIVYGLLPTPVRADGHGFYAVTYSGSLRRWKLKKGRENRQLHWSQFAVISKRLKNARANPQFSEAMMGFPLQWSDLLPLEMDRFRQWWQEFGDC